VSRLQGASNVFSRSLAETWDERVRRLVALGMVGEELRAPFRVKGRRSSEEPHLANLTDAGLERLCAMQDAPAWLIAPAKVMEDGQVSTKRWKPSYWTAPSPEHAFEWDGNVMSWTATKRYVVISCAS
jgi:hypothetical protein